MAPFLAADHSSRRGVIGNTTEDWEYNEHGELASQATVFGGTSVVSFVYDEAGAERDGLGRIGQKTETIAESTRVLEYQYDAQRRLTHAVVNGVLDEQFTYDLNGNRLSAFSPESGTVNATYDNQDRLLSHGEWTFTYTGNGELETKTHGTTGEQWSYEYDALGNLLTVMRPNGTVIEYLVDGFGRRVGKKVGGTLVSRWLYRDALKPVAELDGAGNVVARFVYGSRLNVPDYVRRGAVTYRVISDQLGSPRYVVNVNDAGDVPYRADYSAFGEVTGTGLSWMPFGFAGGIYDADTGLVRFGARDYDPRLGRWLTKDPSGFTEGLNFYVYAVNDPISYVDANGRWLVPAIALGGTLAFAGWILEELTDARAGAEFETEQRWPGDFTARPPGGPADSFRHCVGSCLASNKIGSPLSLLTLDSREYYSEYIDGHPPDQCSADLNNNALGRVLAESGAGTPDECARRCMGAVELGIAITTRP
jgi:RHS repeat-associated protein